MHLNEGTRRLLIAVSTVLGLVLFFWPGLALREAAEDPQWHEPDIPDSISLVFSLQQALLDQGWSEYGFNTLPSREEIESSVLEQAIAGECFIQKQRIRECNREIAKIDALQTIFKRMRSEWGTLKIQEAGITLDSYHESPETIIDRLADALELSQESRDIALARGRNKHAADVTEKRAELHQYRLAQFRYLILVSAPIWLFIMPFLIIWVVTRVMLWIRQGFLVP